MLHTESVPSNVSYSPSKLRIYLSKIPTVITETLIVLKPVVTGQFIELIELSGINKAWSTLSKFL